jgi:putative transposase
MTVNHKRVARLMREAGSQGLYRRRRRGCTVRDLRAEPYAGLVDRDFVVDGADELWCTDITEHPNAGREGLLRRSPRRLLAAHRGMVDRQHHAHRPGRRCAGYGDHPPRPECHAAILHSGHGSQFTSWAFGQRLLDAGPVGSMGSIGDCYAN